MNEPQKGHWTVSQIAADESRLAWRAQVFAQKRPKHERWLNAITAIFGAFLFIVVGFGLGCWVSIQSSDCHANVATRIK